MPNQILALAPIDEPRDLAAGIALKDLATAGLSGDEQHIADLDLQPCPTQSIQGAVSELIAGIIAGRDRAQMRAQWNGILKSASGQGADAVLVACTEINALGQLEDGCIPLVDATVSLAQATVRKYLEVSKRMDAASN